MAPGQPYGRPGVVGAEGKLGERGGQPGRQARVSLGDLGQQGLDEGAECAGKLAGVPRGISAPAAGGS
jgi:hypothetical protein